LLGLFGGLATGLGIVFFLSSIDQSIKTVDQAEEQTGLPVLSTVPKFQGSPQDQRRLIVADEAHSSEAEAFRTLRTALSMLGKKEDRRTFLFTSALPAEGKTFCSLNYALSLAQQGLKTLIIDCDLRRPMVEKTIMANNKRGFGVTDYITGQRSFDEVVQVTEHQNFSYIPAGTMSPNPSELLAQTGIDGLLDEALLRFDRVIVDSAPIHAVSDTMLIMDRIQTLCLVVRCRKTPSKAVRRAVRLLMEAEAPLAGLILNLMPRTRGGYGYYYDSYYDYSYHGYYGDKAKSVVKS
jgi:capsular exopolysaccharide synthesis family protein